MRNPTIPRELERICLKCLAKRRAQRYTTASDLLEDLQAFLAASPHAAVASAKKRVQDAPAAAGSRSLEGSKSTVRADADNTPQSQLPHLTLAHPTLAHSRR